VIRNPWEGLCVDLIVIYTLNGKDGTEIDFMCLTMIDQASSWFEVVELPVAIDVFIPWIQVGKGLPYFDKSSVMTNNLVNMTRFGHYSHGQ